MHGRCVVSYVKMVLSPPLSTSVSRHRPLQTLLFERLMVDKDDDRSSLLAVAELAPTAVSKGFVRTGATAADSFDRKRNPNGAVAYFANRPIL